MTGLRCVSKSWNSTITNPTFITTHLDKAKSLSSNKGYLVYMGGVDDRQLYTVVCNSDRTMTLISCHPLQNHYHDVFMVGFSNGIVCLESYEEDHRIIYLWNPSIRKRKKFIKRLGTRWNYRIQNVKDNCEHSKFKQSPAVDKARDSSQVQIQDTDKDRNTFCNSNTSHLL
uniref:F-box associated domain-containing protein n=1 Tax=Fagus sylvatica TaxID=28930 RepID=A0A2N9HHQ2_FAGSY